SFGLDLKPGKEELVSARLRRLVRGGGFRSFQEYYRHVVGDNTGEALAGMIDALATNHTAFLREPEHFQFLRETVAPWLAARPVGIWSAACATGEEVWTLACLLADLHHDFHIDATDISVKALRFAQRAVYPVERCAGVPKNWLSHYFDREPGPPPAWRIRQELRARAHFGRLNLLDSFSWPTTFPVIFCRNVMIYFDSATQQELVAKLAAALEPGGYLFVGHAESLTRISHSLEYVRPAIYRKPGGKGGRWNRS
ncbi:MAG TPA: protein-glutamate O-methyltransferase CheR, partial [Bryobacteraceae bacterium]